MSEDIRERTDGQILATWAPKAFGPNWIADIATAAGVTRRTVYRWKNDEVPLPPLVLKLVVQRMIAIGMKFEITPKGRETVRRIRAERAAKAAVEAAPAPTTPAATE